MSKTTSASGLISVSGKCLDCGLEFTGNGTALAATRHNAQTGHHVRVEQTTFWEKVGLPVKKVRKRKKRRSASRK